MNRTAKIATTLGVFVAAGASAKAVDHQRRQQRRRRRGEHVEFGTVHGPSHIVISADGIPLHVEVDEADAGVDPKRPTIVFIHGWVCDLDTWHYQRLALRGLNRMVFYDHRGHGQSGRSGKDNSSIAHLADDLARVLEAHVPGEAVLVGHSMGGMTIMELAGLRPDLFGSKVVGVALVSTSSGRLMPPNEVFERLGPLIRRGSRAIDWGRTFNSYSLIRRAGLGPNAQPRHVDMADEMINRASTRALVDFYPAVAALDTRAGLKVLGEIATVVIGGTADLLTPFKHSRRLVEDIPGATLVGVEDAGHMVPFEEHDRVTAAIESLVESVS